MNETSVTALIVAVIQTAPVVGVLWWLVIRLMERMDKITRAIEDQRTDIRLLLDRSPR